MKKLKILVYDTNFVKRVTRVIPILKIKGWQKMNCDITILCTKEGENFYKSVLQNISFISLNYTYKINSIYSLPWEYIKITFCAVFYLKSIINNFDIIYSQSSIIDFLFFPWLLKFFDKKVKWFVMVDNTVSPPNKRFGPFLQKLIPYIAFLFGNQLLKKADGIFVLINSIKDYYQKKGYNVIKTGDSYGIQTEIFKGSIPSTTPKVNALFSGRLHIAKGIFDLVGVAKIVTKKNPDFKLGILGDGDEYIKEEFLKKIESNSLKNNFLFFGYVHGRKKGDIYRKCDLYISLSYGESFGHAILEALACNKVVIAYDLPVYHEVFYKYIRNGQLVLFKQKDFKSIANFILQLKVKNLHFQNKLEDYKWDTIVENELDSMRKSQNMFNRKDKI